MKCEDVKEAFGDSSSGSPHSGACCSTLVVALDLPTAAQAFAMADELRDFPVWVKVGLELFTAEGPDLVRGLLNKGFALFLDLKFYDIPTTVQHAVRSASLLGVNMLTLHVAGGEAMCRAAVAGREQALAIRRKEGRTPDNGPLLMGVTVLTSEAGAPDSIRDEVATRALAAKSWGLDGVVCSGQEAGTVKRTCGQDFLCLCPGIRFASFAGQDDQARVCTPGQAVLNGADFLVMGRPITQAEKPGRMALAAIEEIRQTHVSCKE